MSKMIELSNPDYRGINFMYYKGETQKEILKSKENIINKISKENILGLGYAVNFMRAYGGKSMDDVTSGEDIYEYIFVSVDLQPYGDKLLLCIPLVDIIFEDKYAKER